MKTQLIKLQDKFILVSDEEIKVGDIALDLCEDMGTKFESFIVDKATLKFANQECKKIISKNPDFSLLSEEELKSIGWVDVEKLAKEKYQYVSENPPHVIITPENKLEGFIEGFKAAQSLNDKMFTLEQVINAIEIAQTSAYVSTQYFSGHSSVKHNYTSNDIIQSLQPAVWNVEVEMEDGEDYLAGMVGSNEIWASYPDKPKIINSSLKVIKILT